MKIPIPSLFKRPAPKKKKIKVTQNRVRRVLQTLEGDATREAVLKELYPGKLPRNYTELYEHDLMRIGSALSNLRREGLENGNPDNYENGSNHSGSQPLISNGNGRTNNGHRTDISETRLMPTRDEILRYAAGRVARVFMLTGRTNYNIEELTHPEITADHARYVLEHNLEKLRIAAGLPKGELAIEAIGQARKNGHVQYLDILKEVDHLREGLKLNATENGIAKDLAHDISTIESRILAARLAKHHPDIVNDLYHLGEAEITGETYFGKVRGCDVAVVLRGILVRVLHSYSDAEGHHGLSIKIYEGKGFGSRRLQLDGKAHRSYQMFVENHPRLLRIVR